MSSFQENVGRYLGAVALGQAVSILAAPLLSRLYSPDDYAILGIFNIALQMALVIGTLRLELRVGAASNNVAASRAFRAGFAWLIGVCAGAQFLLLGLQFFSSALIYVPHYFVAFLPIAVFGAGVSAIVGKWFSRTGSLKLLASSRATQSVGTTLLAVIFGLMIGGANALVASIAIGALAGALALWRPALGWRVRLPYRWRNRRLMFSEVRAAAPLATGGLVNTLTLVMPLTIIAVFYSEQETGWYTFVTRLVSAPLALIATAVGESMWALRPNTAASAFDSQSFRFVCGRLSWVAVGCCVILAIGPLYVGRIFGAEWYGAGFILSALAPYLSSQIFGPSLAAVLLRLKDNTYLVRWDVIRAIGGVSIFLLAAVAGVPLWLSLLLLSFWMVAGYLMLYMRCICKLDQCSKAI